MSWTSRASQNGRTHSDLRRLGRWLRYDAKLLAPDAIVGHAAAVLMNRCEVSQTEADVFWRSLCPKMPQFDQPEHVDAFLATFRTAAIQAFERARPRRVYFAPVSTRCQPILACGKTFERASRVALPLATPDNQGRASAGPSGQRTI